ncbi:Ppx/GppA family phosphatase [Metabacillus arenae]|uniref:Ppx/GppA family phosphatase n=1 Tax=Metabacillus arenae TaxID=2771434 RepID=A0A926RXR9_9BACI|nr:Ppx/GppA family phosphatase [Metabacillus arenae]MBD1381271.1 Ppx/GppA family phosphatase [Metabacillus arenae]
MLREKYGIIDIGSNTMRLVIYERDKSGRLREIENVKSVARLRNYLTDQAFLTLQGIDILISTLISFQEVTRHHQLDDIKCVATAAIRQAQNKEEILKTVESKTDYTIRVLSEYEEAYYGFLAVVNSTSVTKGITIDIGGGSTEVTLFENREIVEYHSFPFGALSLKKQFITGDLPSESEMIAIQNYIKQQLAKLPWLHNQNLPIVAIGGSARNMVQIDQALKQYPLAGVHQYNMRIEDITVIKSYLADLPFEELQRVDGLSKDRADIILPAIEVFYSLYKTVAATAFILSRKGLRDGIFYEQLMNELGHTKFPNVIEGSFQELAADYDIDLNHVNHVTNLAVMMVDQLNGVQDITLTKGDRDLLKRGAFVFNLGQYIDSESSSQHTFYLLANRTIDGLLHKDRVKIALIASYKNKDAFKQYIERYGNWFSKEEQKKLRYLGAILKFAYSLNATKRNIVHTISVKAKKDKLTFLIMCIGDWKPEEYQADKQKKHLEKLIKVPVELLFEHAEG